MNSAEQIIDRLLAKKIKISRNVQKLDIKAPKGAMTPELLDDISKNKQQLLDYLGSQTLTSAPGWMQQSIPRVERNTDQPHLLSPAQQRLWLVERINQGSTEYHINLNLDVKGAFDADAAEYALQKIVDRHEVLRTQFYEMDGSGYQRINCQPSFALQRYDLSHLDVAHRPEHIANITAENARRPFDLSSDLLLRASFIRGSDNADDSASILLFCVHHIASDGWSMGIIMQEFVSLYHAHVNGEKDPLPALSIQYLDYAHWQNQVQDQQMSESLKTFWRKQLDDAPRTHSLPLDKPRAAVSKYRGATYNGHIDATTVKLMQTQAQRQNVSEFMFVHAIFSLLISRFSLCNDVVIGTAAANRRKAELESLIGFFVNSLVLRTQVSQQTFAEYLQHVRKINLDAQVHQDISFDALLELLDTERSSAHMPVFQIVLSMNNGINSDVQMDDVEFALRELESVQAKYDIELTVAIDKKGCMGLIWNYDRDLFTASTIEALHQGFANLLNRALEDIDTPMASLSLLSPKLQTPQHTQTQNGENFIDINKTLPEILLAGLNEHLQQQAVTFAHDSALNRSLIYAELEAHSNRFAEDLIDDDIQPGDIVGITTVPGIEMLVAVLGVLKAGAAYVPVDLAQPRERLEYMIQDTGMEVLVTWQDASTQPNSLPRFNGVDIVLLELEEDTDLADYPRPQIRELTPDSMAYIIYTSGSSGKPKAVGVNHRQACHYIQYCADNYSRDDISGSVVSTSLSFDATVTSLLAPLANGKTICILPAELDLMMPALASKLCNSPQNLLFKVTPAHMRALLALPELLTQSQCNHLLVIGGEQLTCDVLKRWQQELLPKSTFINEYGPTETVVGCIAYTFSGADKLDDNLAVPIGRPISRMRCYLLDDNGLLQPQGAIGEIYIAGDGVTNGYINQKELNQTVFFPDHFVTNQVVSESSVNEARMYRSGDLARYLPDGNLVYLGRRDGQVKLNGYRIELEEIERQAERLDAIDSAVAAMFSEEQNNSGKHSSAGKLALYLQLASESDATKVKADVKAHLSSQLPEYMRPQYLVVLKHIPLTVNGKVDRKRLPSPNQNQDEEQTAAETEYEIVLQAIWAELLQKAPESISIETNFFTLGGDSILAIQMVARANKQGLYFSARDIFEYPTIRGLAGIVKQVSRLQAQQTVLTGDMSLLAIHQRFFENETHLNHYNQSLLLRVTQTLKESDLRAILMVLVARHDALRLRYKKSSDQKQNSQWQGHYDASLEEVVQQWLQVHNWKENNFDNLPKFANSVQTSLSLTDGPVGRLVYIKSQDSELNDARLLIVIHHLATDGVSWRILLDDFGTLLQQQQENKPLTLSPKTSSYQAWAEYLHEVKNKPYWRDQHDYWQSVLDAPDTINGSLFDDSQPIDIGELSITLDEEYTAALSGQSLEPFNNQINDLLLAALLISVDKTLGKTQLRVDMEGHGREHLSDQLDVSQTVGWFTSVYPITLQCTSNDMANILCAVKETLRNIPNQGIGFGLLKQRQDEDLEQMQSLTGIDSGMVFNNLGRFDQILEDDGAILPATESTGDNISPQRIRMHPLALNASISQGKLRLNLTYQGQYNTAKLQVLLNNMKVALQSIVRYCERPGVGRKTPSDFPLASVSSEQLNNWQADGEAEDLYPATAMQQGMLFHSELLRGSYVTRTQLRFKAINVEVFKRAWQQVMERHAVFRTRFVGLDSDTPHQLVQKQVALPWRQPDLRYFNETQQNAELEKLGIEDKTLRISANAAPLMHLTLAQLDEESYHLIWTYHHALLDGWSIPLVLAEVIQCYRLQSGGDENSGSHLQPLPPVIPYQSYMAWLQKQDINEAKSFWRERLQPLEEATQMALHHKQQREEDDTHARHCSRVALSTAQSDKLKAFVQKQATTINVLLETAWSLLLSRYCRQNTLVFGATTSGRPSSLSGVENIIGLFINTLPVVVEVNDTMTVSEMLSQQHQNLVTREEYNYLPLTDVQKQSCIRGPLFDTLIVFENTPVNESTTEQPDNVEVDTSCNVTMETTNYAVTLTAAMSETLKLIIDTMPAHFSQTETDQLLTALCTLLNNLVEHINSPLAEIPLTTEEQRDNLLPNNRHVDVAANESVLQNLETQARLQPYTTALVVADKQLTYGQLNSNANQFAHWLQDEGIRSGDIVAVSLPRSAELMICILGIMKTGATLLPLDPAMPEARVDSILQHAGARLLISDKQKQLKENTALCTIDIGNGEKVWHLYETGTTPDFTPTENDSAYIIYTSGSTGKPKGVLVGRAQLDVHIHIMAQHFAMNEMDSALQTASFSFDAFYEVSLSALSVGATLHLMDISSLEEKDYLAYLKRHQISITDIPTVYFGQLLQQTKAEDWQNIPLSRIVIGGEALSQSILETWLSHPMQDKCVVYNCYGPTEAVISSSAWQLSQRQDEQVPIGTALGNRHFYIVDQNLNLITPGFPGELCIGGHEIAQGYLRQDALTTEKFVPDPFIDIKGARMYRTGDLVRQLSDGNLAFLGRIDKQVKIRGFRIEISEIESQLQKCAGVSNGVVTVIQRESSAPQLAGYLVPKQDTFDNASQSQWLEQVREQLAAKLSPYMVPGNLMVIDALPMTTNGKVNLSALPTQGFESATDITLPANEQESQLAAIWAELLELKAEQISVTESFFHYGGHSLLAVRLVGEIKRKMACNLNVRDIFSHSTIQALASLLQESQGTQPQRLIEATPRDGRNLPLSFAQQRFWFIDKLEGGSAHYNMPVLMEIEGEFDAGIAQEALYLIVERHEVLRTTYQTEKDSVVQVIHEEADLFLRVEDFSHLRPERARKQIQKRSAQDIQTSFDLASECLCRVTWFKMADNHGVLYFNLHHIIADAESVDLIQQEFLHFYQAVKLDQKAQLPPLELQYADFALWQRHHIDDERLEADLDYWAQQLQGIPEVHSIPLDHARPAQQSYRGGHHSHALPVELCQKLSKQCQAQSVTPYIWLESVFALLLMRYSDSPEIVIGSPVSGREDPRLDQLIGCFLNNMVIRTTLDENANFAQYLAANKKTISDALALQHVPYDMVVSRLQPSRSLAYSPIHQIRFAMQSGHHISVDGQKSVGSELTSLGFSAEAIKREEMQTKFDLILMIEEFGSNYELRWLYNADIFDSDTIEYLSDSYETLLTAVCDDPKGLISGLPWVNQTQVNELLAIGQGPKSESPAASLLAHFEQQAQSQPNTTAIVTAGRRVSFQELDQAANQLANLFMERTAKTGPVALLLERDYLMPAAILACLKIGRTWLPIDPDNPPARINTILSDAYPALVVTQADLQSKAADFESMLCLLDEDPSNFIFSNLSVAKPDINVGEAEPAYLIYTSGSTGKPKGVTNTYGNLNNFYKVFDEQLNQLGSQSGWLWNASFAFDASMKGLVCLALGRTVFLLNQDQAKSPMQLVAALEAESVDVLNGPPQLIEFVLPHLQKASHAAHLIVSGDDVSPTLWQQIVDYCQSRNTKAINAYGPTEITVNASFAEITKNSAVNIGRPVINSSAYIMSPGGTLLPKGAIGELCIGGQGVAQGYWKDQELTDKAFFNNPYSPTEKLYRTGDRARFDRDGHLQFLGRLDRQIKHRGYRIELGEISRIISTHLMVAMAQVLLNKDANGQSRLIAYVAKNEQQSASTEKHSTEELANWTALQLPGYMLPDAYHILDTMPLTSGGKIDNQVLKQLPMQNALFPEKALSQRTSPAQGVSPEQRTAIDTNATCSETAKVTDVTGINVVDSLKSIWCDVLQCDQVSADDDFFQKGGHSLLAMKLLFEVDQAFNITLDVRDLYNHMTFDSQVDCIKSQLGISNETEGSEEVAFVTEANSNGLSKAAISAKLNAIWCDILQLEYVAPEDDFFKMGGHSLLAMKLLFEVDQAFDVTLDVRDLYNHLTFGAQVEHLCGVLSVDGESVDEKIVDHTKTFPEAAATAKSIPQATSVSAQLERIWCDILNRDTVAPGDDFFQEGGHSLLAMKLLFEIDQAFGITLDVRDLYNHLTFQSQIEHIKAALGSSGEAADVDISQAAQQVTENVIPAAAPTPTKDPHPNVAQKLRAIWCNVLQKDYVAEDDDFFKSGGHSLLAMKLLFDIDQTFNVTLDVRDLYSHLTLKSQTALLVSKLPESLTTAVQIAEPAANKQVQASLNRAGKDKYQMLRTRGDIPLSFAQQRIWFIDRLQGKSVEFNMPVALEVCGAWSNTTAQSALQQLVQRHEILRTVYVEKDGRPVQLIKEHVEVTLHTEDLSNVGGDLNAHVQYRVNDHARKVFALNSDLMLDVSYLLTAKATHSQQQQGVLLFNMHHIASDGWSMQVLIREFVSLYMAELTGQPAQLPDLPQQYADFACWQRQWLSEDKLSQLLGYWRSQLADLPESHSIALDFPRPAQKQYQGAVVNGRLGAEHAKAISTLAKHFQLTPFMLIHAALGLMLSRHSNSQDIVIGTPVANRTRPGLENMLGVFINNLVLRINPEQHSVAAYLSHLKDVNLQAQAHQDAPFELLVDKLNVARNRAHAPLFQIMFGMNTIEKSSLVLPGLSFKPMKDDAYQAKFDLNISAELNDNGLLLNWGYDTSLFSQARIEAFNHHLLHILTTWAAQPDIELEQLKALPSQEMTQVCELLRGETLSKGELLPRAISKNTFEKPDAVAISQDDISMSYGQLEQQSSDLARQLLDLGLEGNQRVGVMMPRTPQMLVCLLSVLKAGGAYVPLDPNFPQGRLEYMVSDSGLKIILTTQKLWLAKQEAQMQLPEQVKIVELDTFDTRQTISQTLPSIQSADIAYHIYTSGSTGTPKGVTISHGALANLMQGMLRRVDGAFNKDCRLLAVTTLAFDIAALELFGPLLVGGQIVLNPQDGASNPEQIATLISDNDINVMQATPMTWQLLMDAGWKGNQQLIALCGGEALAPTLAEKLLQKCRALWNCYGPTEATIWSLVSKVSEEDISKGQITLSGSLANYQHLVLDEQQRPVPLEVIGELCISGDSLAEGYHGLQNLTRERFISHPFGAGAKIYRTGDKVRLRKDGKLIFAGRNDNQLKIRGYRIEPAEIEQVLRNHVHIRDAIVGIVSKPGSSQSSHSSEQGVILGAWLLTNENCELTETVLIEDVRQHTLNFLPGYMVPSRFASLAQWPLTPNGKVDRRALTDAKMTLSSSAPSISEEQIEKSGTETVLAELWANVINADAEQIGPYSDFFAIGGHSLLVLKLLNAIETKFDVRLAVSDIFVKAQLYEQARFIDNRIELSASGDRGQNSCVVRLNTAEAEVNLFCIPPRVGSAMVYREVSAALEDYAMCYGLQPPHLYGDQQPNSMDALASFYVDAIRATQPAGDYHLLGYSLGGQVAAEIARQLEQYGYRVVFLGLVDASCENNLIENQVGQAAPTWYNSVKLSIEAYLNSTLNLDWQSIEQLDQALGIQYLISVMKQQKLNFEGFDDADIERYLNYFCTIDKLSYEHQFAAFNAPITLFRSEHRSADESRTLGWHNLNAGEITVKSINAPHMALMEQPHVHTVITAIKQHLDGKNYE